MDAATTGRGRLAAQCRKHASAPPARFRPRNGVPETTVLPAQRPDRPPWRAELASGTSVAGDDPVNGTDPTGLSTEGYCFSVSVQLSIFNGVGAGCAVRTDNGNETGFTLTLGGGIGAVGGPSAFTHVVQGFGPSLLRSLLAVNLTASLEYQQTNANTLSELTGWFSYSTVSVTVPVLDVTGTRTQITGAGNQNSNGCGSNAGPQVTGTEYGVGINPFSGLDAGAPVGAAGGKTYTWLIGHDWNKSLVNDTFDGLDFLNPWSPDW